ncbi:MAG: DUF423 domain-containing protein [Verrucomicrobiales bacterium]|nr:DUF423 domain-containing protein [Verrucomicrobiales bacterium]
MLQPLAFRISAAAGFLGVALGAFGAHGLKDLLARHDTTAIWHTAVLYHLVHAVVMLGLASGAVWRRGAWLFLLGGLLIFSGSLYVLAVTNLRQLGMVTPLGGVAFLLGWGTLVFQGLGRRAGAGQDAGGAH